MCNNGYAKFGDVCSLLPAPRLVLQPPPSVSEDVSSPAKVEFKLSRQPTANVSVSVLNTDGQLSLTGSVTFTSENWNQFHSIYIVAVDDVLVEGTHNGVLSLLLSSADEAWNKLNTSVTITVADNDCPPATKPQHGSIVGDCQATYGKECIFECNTGLFLFDSCSLAQEPVLTTSCAWTQDATHPCMTSLLITVCHFSCFVQGFSRQDKS